MYHTLSASFLVLVVLSAAAGCGQHAAPSATIAVDPCLQHLPSGWTIKESLILDSRQTADIGKKLGGINISQISNTHLLIDGKQLQLNILVAKNAEDAAKVHGAISRSKGDPAFCLINDTKVYEYVGDSSITAAFVKNVSSQLGI